MIAFFDTETTGLPQRYPGNLAVEPHVLQLAVSLYDEQRRPVFELSTLVNLPQEASISTEALAVHGISAELTRNYGVTKLQAVKLLAFAFDRASVVVAHNLQFDRRLIEFDSERANVPSLFTDLATFCTMEASTGLLKLPPTPKMLKYGRGPYKNPSLKELYNFLFSEDFDNAHDALVDTRACARCYFEMKDRGYI